MRLRFPSKLIYPILISFIFFGCDQNKIDKPNVVLIIGDDHGCLLYTSDAADEV
mgnify:CR=1 FL=1